MDMTKTFFQETSHQANNMNSTDIALCTIDFLWGRIRELEQQIANLQAANADLSSNNNYLRALLVSSPDPNTVPQTVLEVEEQPSKRPREGTIQSSDGLSLFVGDDEWLGSNEETVGLLDDCTEDHPFLVPLENSF